MLELPLLRLCTDGAAAIEAGGAVVRSPAGAPGNPQHQINNTNTASKRLTPTPQRDELDVEKTTFLYVEGWGWRMMCHHHESSQPATSSQIPQARCFHRTVRALQNLQPLSRAYVGTFTNSWQHHRSEL